MDIAVNSCARRSSAADSPAPAHSLPVGLLADTAARSTTKHSIPVYLEGGRGGRREKSDRENWVRLTGGCLRQVLLRRNGPFSSRASLEYDSWFKFARSEMGGQRLGAAHACPGKPSPGAQGEGLPEDEPVRQRRQRRAGGLRSDEHAHLPAAVKQVPRGAAVHL